MAYILYMAYNPILLMLIFFQTIVWDGDHGNELQKLPSNGGTVFDVMTFSAYESNFLATLTEQKLSFYQWP